jgi:hypothetical protein
MSDRPRWGVAALAFFAFACGYNEEKEVNETVSLQVATPACPTEESLKPLYERAELTHEEVVTRAPLCWYAVEDQGTEPLCSGATNYSFAELREKLRNALPWLPAGGGLDPEDSPSLLCTDAGPRLLVLGSPAGCDETLEGAPLTRVAPWVTDMVSIRDLVAVDERSPLRTCNYDTTRTVSEPHDIGPSCGLFPGPGQL